MQKENNQDAMFEILESGINLFSQLGKKFGPEISVQRECLLSCKCGIGENGFKKSWLVTAHLSGAISLAVNAKLQEKQAIVCGGKNINANIFIILYCHQFRAECSS